MTTLYIEQMYRHILYGRLMVDSWLLMLPLVPGKRPIVDGL